MKRIISASILAADFANLQQEVEAVLQAGVDYIHLDIMDHHFVPNLSFGSVVCKALREAGIQAPIDVHLMVENPEKYIDPFAKAGATLLAFHPETVSDVAATIKKIQSADMKVGLVLNPETEVNIIKSHLASLDLILLMSVNPGFSGQAFIPETVEKIKRVRSMVSDANATLYVGVDGGIKVGNIEQTVEAGADFFVVGSGLFEADDYVQRLKGLGHIP